jgi:hypothetical protein
VNTFIFDEGRKNEMAGKTLQDEFLIQFVFSFGFDCEIFVNLLVLSGLFDGTELSCFSFALNYETNVHRLQLWCSFSNRLDGDL